MKMVEKYIEFKKEDILAGKIDVWNLIQPLWDSVSIYDGLDVYLDNAKPFTDEQRRILAIFWYDAEINNGGHDQFYFNSTGVVWKDAYEGFKMIGADAYAENLKQTIDCFGGEIPFDREERQAALEQLNDKQDFDDFDAQDRFYYKGEGFSELLEKFVKAHADKFVIKGTFSTYE